MSLFHRHHYSLEAGLCAGKQLAGSSAQTTKPADTLDGSAGPEKGISDVQESAIPLDSDDAMGVTAPEAQKKSFVTC